MANRHSNKKLRAEIRARSAATGESYQAARHRILTRGPRGATANARFLHAQYFGIGVTFASWEQHGHRWTMLIPGGGGRAPRTMRELSSDERRRLAASPKPVFLHVRRLGKGSVGTEPCRDVEVLQ